MAQYSFDVLDWLSGLTVYTFDKSLLTRVAADYDILEATSVAEISMEVRYRCEAELLKAVYYGPNTIAGSTHKHGAFTQSIGQQQITADVRDRIAKRLKELGDLLDEELLPDQGTVDWVHEQD